MTVVKASTPAAPPAAAPVHVGDQLVDRLIQYGTRHVFGCPGGQTLPLYNGIAKRPGEIAHILMRDERSAAFAADAYARATGRLGVCDATVGPGASNLVSGLVEAYSSSVPVMAIVSDIPRHWEHRRRLGSASQGYDQRKFLEGCVKWYGRVETADMLADILHACVRIATSGRPGPVVLEIPDDVFAGAPGAASFAPSAEWTVFPRLRPAPDPAAIAQAVARLRASARPMIVAGGGALHAGAGDAVRQLAEVLECPVATTVSGKGLVAETHPLSVGVAGRFGVPMANSLLAVADCIVFIGCKTGQTTTNGWTNPETGVPVIHIDVDPEEIGRNYPDSVGVYADAKLGTAALVDAARAAKVRTRWDHGKITSLRTEWWDGPIHYKQAPKDGILKPQDLLRIMREAMGEKDMMVSDASLASGWIAGRWQMRSAGRYSYAPRGLAGLGWGLPAAIGVSVALRDREPRGRVVCLAGDGGWGYSMADVETAVRIGLPIIAIVINNSTLAWIKHSAANRYPAGMVSEDFVDVSYADAARALGATAASVDTLDAFKRAFVAALADGGDRPWVIEARTCDIETPVLANAPTAVGGY
ncbi:MAG TPA: thiamine pyrophosphate-binding protein [Candidatus Limnocylindria bacterium]|nr:thiamine pyrophosphate-binding protein [Candidatus Limnocylindria bacterium]